VLGLGTIGQDTTRKFALLGFPTMGWSRTPKAVQCVKTFHGPDGLDRLLARANTWSTSCRSPATRTAC
jgi:glyoxylate/hydroxypyruvate reductase A